MSTTAVGCGSGSTVTRDTSRKQQPMDFRVVGEEGLSVECVCMCCRYHIVCVCAAD